jgi:hypothetical protein
LPDVGNEKRIINTTTQKIASQATGLDHRLRLQTRSLFQASVVAPR